MDEIKSAALAKHIPIIQDGGLAFLIELIKERKVERILELGTAVGYSAIKMAEVRDDIIVESLERDPILYAEAVKNVQAHGLSDRIKLYLTDIFDFKSDRSYDLIFVDAAKAQYGKYLELFLPNLAKKGIMVFDNIEFHGLVKHPERTQNRNTKHLVKKLKNFRELVQADKRFDIIIYEDVGDGILTLTGRDTNET